MDKSRIALYLRVSTEEQYVNGFGLELQKEKLNQFCVFKGWNNLTWFIDTCSGGSMKRPELKKLLRKVKKNQFDIVLTYRADRLSRSLKDLLLIIEDFFEPNGVVYISATEDFNSGTASGKAYISMLGTFSELERNTIKERTLGGKLQKVQRGGYVTGSPPFGYQTKGKSLIVNPQEAEIVKRIFKMKASGISLNKISKKLNDLKIEKSKGKKWYPSSIKYILSNSIYRGLLQQKIKGQIYEAYIPELVIIK
jgi:site-specific DNA recombinase